MATADRTALAHQAYETHATYYSLGHEVWSDEFATYIRNRDIPLVLDANLAHHITCTTEEDVRALYAHVDAAYAACPHRAFAIAPDTPPVVPATLALDDHTRDEGMLLCLEDELQATPPRADIREIETETDWAAWRQLDDLNQREEHGAEYSAEVTRQVSVLVRIRSREVRYWLAYDDGVPCAYFSSWVGPEGIGYLEDLFTHPDYRHRGIATALIAHALADARARGAGPCLIPVGAEATPKHMYAAMGFRPLTLTRAYFSTAEAPD